MDIQLIYHSIARSHIVEEDLRDILATSVDFNGANDITGCLLHFRGEFLQILEGERQIVSDLFERIEEDNRHHHVSLMYKESCSKRVFGAWAMAYGSLDAEDMMVLANRLGVHQLTSLEFTGPELEAIELFNGIGNDILNRPLRF